LGRSSENLVRTFFLAARLSTAAIGLLDFAQFFGNEPAGYHLANILLHATNAVLVCALGVRLGLRFAWIGALVFLLHP